MQTSTVAAKYFLACVMMVAAPVLFAQAPQSTPAGQDATANAEDATAKALDLNVQMIREDIRSHRKQITAANMTLTADEATKFWPIYDQYIQETIKINDVRWALIKDYAANYDKASDQLAQDYMSKSASTDQQLVALREKYVPLFEKVVSPKKTALWYQIDRRLDLMINLQLTALMPLVDPNK